MASVTYNIKGKYDGKAIKSAQSGIQSLAKAATSFNLAVAGFVAGKVMQGIKKVVDGSTDAFIAQNKAVANFNKAMQNSMKITAEGANKIASSMAKMSKNNFFDADTLNNNAAFLASMKLNEEQIIAVMDAATEMAAAGIMPLDNAVKALSQSYNGNVAQLAKINPALKNLTKAQLENGEAVKLMKAQYNGFSDAMSNTFAGRAQQYANNMSDLKAAIGGIGASLAFVSQGKMANPLQDLTKSIEDNRTKIINFFLNLPQIAKVAFDGIVKIIDHALTVEGFLGYLKLWFTTMLEQFKFTLNVMFDYVKMYLRNVADVFDFVYGNIFRLIQDKFGEMLNNVIEKINKLSGNLPSWLKKLMGIENGATIDFRFSTDNAERNKSLDETIENIKLNFKNFGKDVWADFKKTFEARKDAIDGFADIFSEETSDLVANLKKLLTTDLPEDLENALQAGANKSTTTGPSPEIKAETSAKDTMAGIADAMKSFAGAFGDIGQIIQMISSSNIIGLIIQFISAIIGKLREMSPALDTIMNAFDTIAGIATKFIDLKNLDEAIQPFIDGMDELGGIFGTVLNVIFRLFNAFKPIFDELTSSLDVVLELLSGLMPIIELLLKIIHGLATAISYVMKLIQGLASLINKAFIAIVNAFVSMINGIIKVVNKLPGVNISKISKVSEIETDNFAVTPSAGESTTTSASASYTAARDIYVNIYYEHSFVNGDATAIAIGIRDEIKRAEKLGY